MICSIKECVLHASCGILEITKKTPKNATACSYFKSQSQVDKKKKRQEKYEAELEAKQQKRKK